MRYHFEVERPNGLALDEEGEEFSSDQDALKEAVYAARELASERVLLGDALEGWAIVLRKEGDHVVARVKLTEVVHGGKHWFPPGSNPQSNGSPQH